MGLNIDRFITVHNVHMTTVTSLIFVTRSTQLDGAVLLFLPSYQYESGIRRYSSIFTSVLSHFQIWTTPTLQLTQNNHSATNLTPVVNFINST